MHVYKIVHGGDSNKYDNLNFTKLFYAWLEIFKRYLHGNENLIIRRNMYLIFWDGRITVISWVKNLQNFGKFLIW